MRLFTVPNGRFNFSAISRYLNPETCIANGTLYSLVTDELFTLESEYMRIFIEPSKVNISVQVLQQWLKNLDKIYLSYLELMGGGSS